MNKELVRLWELCPHYLHNHYCGGECPHYNNGICELSWDYPNIFPIKCGKEGGK